MPSRRYTILIADRTTGVIRRLTISLRSAAAVLTGALLLPLFVGIVTHWLASSQIEQLRRATETLAVENSSYRAATGELTGQIQSLESVIDDLGPRASLDPDHARAMQRLPAVVKSRAAGGGTTAVALSGVLSSSFIAPEDTFAVLKNLLRGLESRLSRVSVVVERQEALAAATPSIWPAHGWLSGTFGRRADPFTGEAAFHQGLDIATEKGQPVFATADGVVQSASPSGEYGNLVVIRHNFGLSTRYGHLSRFNVVAGQSVKRGDVIGYVGSTGRATGYHLHYEILVNGRLLNPLQLLTQPVQRTAAD